MTPRRRAPSKFIPTAEPPRRYGPEWEPEPLTWGYQQPDVRVIWTMYRPWQIAEMAFRLPPMQRPVVWDRARQLAYVRSVWAGLPTAPIILWGRWSSDVAWILDGQQRLTALGVCILNAAGEPQPVVRWGFDGVAGEWIEGDELSFLEATEYPRLRALNFCDPTDVNLRQQGHVALYRHERLQGLEVPIARIEGDPKYAAAAFRALAMPGVPWDPAEIDRMVASCADWQPRKSGN